MLNNKTFYPTPGALALQMWHMIPTPEREKIISVLEPSAGKGDIIEALKNTHDGRGLRFTTIEKDADLVATLRGKGFPVIAYDFLTYDGRDNFDAILMNPPFIDGDAHFLKALEVIWSGHIVCLLNAETLRNPHTNNRKLLVQKLEELGARIEYKTGAFEMAERRTSVEITMVHVHIKPVAAAGLADELKEAPELDASAPGHQNEVATPQSIRELVAAYNRTVDLGLKTITDFHENAQHLQGLLSLRVGLNDDTRAGGIKAQVNEFLRGARLIYWRDVVRHLDAIKSRMTVAKRREFEQLLAHNSQIDFTEANIRQFIINLATSFDEILTAAVVDLFDKMTRRHSWHEDAFNKTIHYFNGWKTNQAFFVNQKIILPFYGESFIDWCGRWRLNYQVEDQLNDIDLVMRYFDGGKKDGITISQAVKAAFEEGRTSGIDSEYFTITVYKKGTCHLTFKSEDIRRRFNVTACKGKNWLPADYGTKKYSDLAPEERRAADSFEGMKSYIENVTATPTLFHSGALALPGIAA